MSTTNITADMVKTPAGGGGLLGFLVRRPWAMRLLARFGAFQGRMRTKPSRSRLRKTVAVVRHEHVVEVLARDGDFFVEPYYGPAIRAVNDDFILGMDRGPKMQVERALLYKALAQVDLAAIVGETAKAADAILTRTKSGQIDAVRDYAWELTGRTAQHLFGIAPDDKPLFLHCVRAIFYHIFLNIGNDRKVEARALLAKSEMRKWFESEITARRKSGNFGTDFMGRLLGETADDDLIRRTLAGMLVGAIDTTTNCIARILMVLDANPEFRASAHAVRHDLAALYPICLEALRFNPQAPGMRRKAAHDTILAGQEVKKGDEIQVQTLAAMFDRSAFPDPLNLRPDRNISSYLHFGFGIHACAGRALNALQIPMLVGKLLDADFRIVSKPKWAGPFPDSLPISFDWRER